MHKVSSMSVMI